MSWRLFLCIFFLVSSYFGRTDACSCLDYGFESYVCMSDFAANVRVSSLEQHSSTGSYYEIKIPGAPNNLFKGSSNVERIYRTQTESGGPITSCDARTLQKNKNYLIVGGNYQNDGDAFVESVTYFACWIAIDWDNVSAAQLDFLKAVRNGDYVCQ